MAELKNTTVLINNVEFHAVRVLSLDMSIKPLSHPVEQLTIVDHIRQEPRKFKLVLKMFDRWEDSKTLAEERTEKLDLISLWHNDRKLNSLKTDMGDFYNMLIVKAKVIEDNNSESSFDAELEMQEVMVAFMQAVEDQWYVDINGGVYEQSPYEQTTAEGVLSEPKPDGQDKQGWAFGYNCGEIGAWIISGGDDGINWKWPWD